METVSESRFLRKRIREAQEFARTMSVFFSVNEEGVMAYALVRVPPPNYATRIVQRFWCSDPTIKDRIIAEIQKLEFP